MTIFKIQKKTSILALGSRVKRLTLATAFLCVTLVSALMSPSAAFAQAKEGNQANAYPSAPLSKSISTKSRSINTTTKTPSIDLEALRAKTFDKSGNQISKVIEFAQAHNANVNLSQAQNKLTTLYNGEEYQVWTHTIESPNAYSLNLGFSHYFMPEGGSLFLYADGYQELVRPFTFQDNEEHGELWTPLINGNKIIIEVNIPTKLLSQLKLSLGTVNQAFLDFKNPRSGFNFEKSGSCNVDVICPQGDQWRDQIRSVARYTREGRYLCTGAAINNYRQDNRPYFLTADHCGITSSNDNTIVAYWNYESSVCRTPGSSASGGNGGGSFSQFNSGTTIRSANASFDVSLLEFDDPILAAANVYLAGWDRSANAPTSSVAIHHPSGDEKRISFEDDASTLTFYGSPTSNSNGTHIRVADWDIGTTEGGSSGSPLFNANKHIVGQLHGGAAACGNDLADWYGRFYRSWTGGGSDATRLSNWLDPDGQSGLSLDGKNVNNPSEVEDDDMLLLLIPAIISGAKK